MKIYRCRICGDVFIGNKAPSDCPFCGSPEKYMVPGNEWRDENEGVELTDISRKNLEAALKLEIYATNFYRCVENITKDIAVQSMFKGFRKVEAEHVSLLTKILKLSKDELEEIKAECTDTDKKMIEKTANLEDNAIKEYIRSAKEATEERVKDIFVALAVAERGHLVLANEMLDK